MSTNYNSNKEWIEANNARIDNITAGVNNLPEYQDVDDTNANSNDLILNKKAFVKGTGLITGTIEEVASYSEKEVNNAFIDGNYVAFKNTNNSICLRDNASLKVDNSKVAEAIGLTSNKILKDVSILGVIGTVEHQEINNQDKTITANGTYSADVGYTGLGEITVNVQAQLDDQHMPFYMLISDDEGNLWCANNYDTLQYVPYSLDEDGNLIILQDDDDSALYNINENMELEVVVNG